MRGARRQHGHAGGNARDHLDPDDLERLLVAAHQRFARCGEGHLRIAFDRRGLEDDAAVGIAELRAGHEAERPPPGEKMMLVHPHRIINQVTLILVHADRDRQVDETFGERRRIDQAIEAAPDHRVFARLEIALERLDGEARAIDAGLQHADRIGMHRRQLEAALGGAIVPGGRRAAALVTPQVGARRVGCASFASCSRSGFCRSCRSLPARRNPSTGSRRSSPSARRPAVTSSPPKCGSRRGAASPISVRSSSRPPAPRRAPRRPGLLGAPR